MRTKLTRAAIATAVAGLLLAGCSTSGGSTETAESPEAATSSVPAAAEPLLADFGLEGMDTVEIVDHLERLGGEDRPTDLMASVRVDELLVSSGGEEYGLALPEDRFYLSVAPYVDQTHECFYHSLTTCKGELGATDVEVQIVDETNDEVLVDGTETTFDNGFVGFWLPRDIEGTLRVSYDGKTAEMDFATDEEAPTCVTTLQLA
ncbi:CueP family metal-binding protein [Nocardioides pakistanensis]